MTTIAGGPAGSRTRAAAWAGPRWVAGGMVLALGPVCADAQTTVTAPSATATAGTPAKAGAVTGKAPRAGDAAADAAALEALIPRSALTDPQSWALDPVASSVTPAAPASTAAREALSVEATTPVLPDLSTLSLDNWQVLPLAAPSGPGTTSATPAEPAVPASVTSLPLTARVMLAIAGPKLPEQGEIVGHFRALSSLVTLGTGEDNLAQLTRRARADLDTLRAVLQSYGYYDASVSFTLVPASASAPAGARRQRRARASGPLVRLDVVPGPGYRFAVVAAPGLEAAGSEAPALLRELGLKAGDRVNAARIVAARTAFVRTLGDHGYALARVGDPDLVVDHRARGATLTMPVTPGGRYRFGAITGGLPHWLGPRHLARIARFRTGQPWRAGMVEDLRRALLTTGLVSEVTVTPHEVTAPAPPSSDAASSPAPGIADVAVALTRGPTHTLAGTLGYSSGSGYRLEGSWESRNMFPPEGNLKVRGVLGTLEQLAGVTFRRENLVVRDVGLSADLYAQHIISDAYRAETLSAVTTIESRSTPLFPKPWTWSIGLETIGTIQTTSTTPHTAYFIAGLPLGLVRDRSMRAGVEQAAPTSGATIAALDPDITPVRERAAVGYRVALTLTPTWSVTSGSAFGYVNLGIDSRLYWPLAPGVVLAGRAHGGALVGGGDLLDVAPSQRYYAGGASSVRGYGFQRVGPLDASGNPLGGRSIAEFSLEARLHTGLSGGAISVVPFVDAGTLGTGLTPAMRSMQFGAGLGMRYQTRFGPLRIDLGTPLNRRPGDSVIGLYIAIGQAF